MAFTQTDLDNVERAIASGELSFKSNGREVMYRSMADLMAARDLIAKAIPRSTVPAPATFGGRSYGLASFNND